MALLHVQHDNKTNIPVLSSISVLFNTAHRHPCRLSHWFWWNEHINNLISTSMNSSRSVDEITSVCSPSSLDNRYQRWRRPGSRLSAKWKSPSIIKKHTSRGYLTKGRNIAPGSCSHHKHSRHKVNNPTWRPTVSFLLADWTPPLAHGQCQSIQTGTLLWTPYVQVRVTLCSVQVYLDQQRAGGRRSIPYVHLYGGKMDTWPHLCWLLYCFLHLSGTPVYRVWFYNYRNNSRECKCLLLMLLTSESSTASKQVI